MEYLYAINEKFLIEKWEIVKETPKQFKVKDTSGRTHTINKKRFKDGICHQDWYHCARIIAYDSKVGYEALMDKYKKEVQSYRVKIDSYEKFIEIINKKLNFT